MVPLRSTAGRHKQADQWTLQVSSYWKLPNFRKIPDIVGTGGKVYQTEQGTDCMNTCFRKALGMYNLNTIKFTHFAYDFMDFSKLTELANHSLGPGPNVASTLPSVGSQSQILPFFRNLT